MYTIGRLARRTRVNADSIRFYERQGLLAPSTKTASGYRLYSDDAVRRVAFVKHAQRCGFALAEIRELLDIHKADEKGRANAFDLAAEKQTQIGETLRALNAMSAALTRLLATRNDPAADYAIDAESPLVAALDSVVAEAGDPAVRTGT
jgi:MerR family Zn(II)-responsive transcriptional regulator of zntA